MYCDCPHVLPSLSVREANLSFGKFADMHSSLLEKEASVRQLKHKQAMLRMQNQTRQLIEAQRNYATRESNREVQIKDQEDKVRERSRIRAEVFDEPGERKGE